MGAEGRGGVMLLCVAAEPCPGRPDVMRCEMRDNLGQNQLLADSLHRKARGGWIPADELHACIIAVCVLDLPAGVKIAFESLPRTAPPTFFVAGFGVVAGPDCSGPHIVEAE